MRRLLVEAIGTFFLVLTVGTAVLGSAPLAPLAIGAILMAMVYAGGHISGGHYNPAVTLAVWIHGRINTKDAALYWAAQILGALAAAPTARYIDNAHNVAALSPTGHGLAAAATAEALFTFALAYVVLNVATSDDNTGNSFYGLAIGFTVAAGAVVAGKISAAVFNPAVALGAATIGLLSWSKIWLWLAATLAGAAAAGACFNWLTNTHPHTPRHTLAQFHQR